VTVDQTIAAAPKKKHRRQMSEAAAKARSKDSLRALSKLAERVDGTYRIKNQAPLLVPLRELARSMDPDALSEQVTASVESHRNTLADNRRVCSTVSSWSTSPSRWSGSAARVFTEAQARHRRPDAASAYVVPVGNLRPVGHGSPHRGSLRTAASSASESARCAIDRWPGGRLEEGHGIAPLSTNRAIISPTVAVQ